MLAESPADSSSGRPVRDPNRLVMQTPLEALAEAREEILALLAENRELQEEIRRLREQARSGDPGGE
jgi:hypothetical protein